eukprot:3758901-Amphidinium_carterae.1
MLSLFVRFASHEFPVESLSSARWGRGGKGSPQASLDVVSSARLAANQHDRQCPGKRLSRAVNRTARGGGCAHLGFGLVGPSPFLTVSKPKAMAGWRSDCHLTCYRSHVTMNNLRSSQAC